MTEEQQRQEYRKLMGELTAQWKARREAQGWKPGTATYTKHQLEFFLGAHAALVATGKPNGIGPVLMLMSVGRSVEELFT